MASQQSAAIKYLILTLKDGTDILTRNEKETTRDMNNMGRSPKRHAKLFRTHTLRFIDFGHVLGHEHGRMAQKNGVFFRFVQNSFF